MPVVVDLPLVPATPMRERRGVEQLRQQLGARHHLRADAPRGDDIGHGVFDRGRGDNDLVGAVEPRCRPAA